MVTQAGPPPDVDELGQPSHPDSNRDWMAGIAADCAGSATLNVSAFLPVPSWNPGSLTESPLMTTSLHL